MNLWEFTPEQQRVWDEWVASRPPVIQDLCKKLQPNKLYLLKTTGHRVTAESFNENGTVTVIVSGKYNAVIFPRRVFGINPDDLEECGLPAADEPVGVLLTEPKEIDAFIEKGRPLVLGPERKNKF